MSDLSELAAVTEREIVSYAKERYDDDPDVPELGDYIPFLYYIGQEEWVERQIDQSVDALSQPAAPSKREDTIVGLIEHHRLSGSDRSLALTENYFEFFFDTYVDGGKIRTPYFDRLANDVDFAKYNHPRTLVRAACTAVSPILERLEGRHLPPYHSMPRNGIFVELLADAYELTGSERYLRSATELAAEWIESDTFQQVGLFETPPLFPWRARFARVFKDNTGILNGLITLADVTPDEDQRRELRDSVRRWAQAVETHCFDGVVHGVYELETGETHRPELFYGFSLIDVLCYAYHQFGDSYFLEFARSIADAWLQHQTELGLVPLTPDGTESHHDTMTDFSIALLRLAELSGESEYEAAARDCLRGLFRHHRFPLYVDTQTGEPTTDETTPRFVTLMLKAVIALEVDSIYGEKDVFKLLRDR